MGLQRFYDGEFQNAKELGYSDQEAHKHAAFMVDFYGHQFRRYVPTDQPVGGVQQK
ncbi:hypothetical protein ACFQ40_01115 [Kroppenstedtia eburnea]|uniref:hypothetical protein n=1 Tax=Kroppenstedtia eburnea TaxID=714067 RepID=UPI00363160A7